MTPTELTNSVVDGTTSRRSTEDAALSERVDRMFRESHYRPLRQVAWTCEAGRVTLRGEVPSFHLKQVAQSLIGRLPGVAEVDNRLQVVDQFG